MAGTQLNGFVRHLRQTALRQDEAGLNDGELLERFLTRRDDGAFEALLRRHGAMVWGVCRRVLDHEADAEDAFQATFLVLVRKAASITPRSLVGNWLYGVAHNTALKAKAMNRKRRAKERLAGERPRPEGVSENWQKLQALLDVELSRLPDKYRAPLVLCELRGLTRKEAARQLGWPEGTVAGRLARARARLAVQLARHGLTLSAGALAAALAHGAAGAATPAHLMTCTIESAAALAAGQAVAACAIPARVAALTEGVLKAMLLTKLKVGTAVLLTALLIAPLTTALGLRAAGRADPPGPEAAGPAVAAAQVPAGPADGKGAKPADEAKAQPCKSLAAFDLGGKGASIFSVAVDPEGKVAAAGQEGKVRVWEIATGNEVATLDQAGSIWSVAFSPDGKLLATGSKDGTAKLWDAANGQEKAALNGHTANVNSVAFSPDGNTLATGSFDGTARLWDVATGKEIRRLPGPQAVTAVAFSPDGNTLAVADGMARTIKLCEVASGKVLHALTGHTDLVWCVAFSPDGKTLASGSRDHTVRLWDPATGKAKGVLKGHVSQVNGVAFSPDSRTLVSAGGTGDHLVRVWDVATGKEVGTLRDHGETVWAVGFARGTKVFATGGNDGTARLWHAGMQAGEKK